MSSYQNQKENKFSSIIVDEVHSNISQEIIEITSDRLTIILNRHIDCLHRSKEWQTPLSLLLTILLVLLTSSFKEAFGLSAAIWQAIFIIACLISFLWLAYSLIRNSKTMTIEDLLKVIKNKS